MFKFSIWFVFLGKIDIVNNLNGEGKEKIFFFCKSSIVTFKDFYKIKIFGVYILFFMLKNKMEVRIIGI